MRALFGARHGVSTDVDGENGELSNEKNDSLVFWAGAPISATIGERRVAADVVLETKDFDADRDAGARAGRLAERAAQFGRHIEKVLSAEDGTNPIRCVHVALMSPWCSDRMNSRSNQCSANGSC